MELFGRSNNFKSWNGLIKRFLFLPFQTKTKTKEGIEILMSDTLATCDGVTWP